MTLAERIESVRNAEADARNEADAIERHLFEEELEAFRNAYERRVIYRLAEVQDVECCAYCGTPETVRYYQRGDLYLCDAHAFHSNV